MIGSSRPGTIFLVAQLLRPGNIDYQYMHVACIYFRACSSVRQNTFIIKLMFPDSLQVTGRLY